MPRELSSPAIRNIVFGAIKWCVLKLHVGLAYRLSSHRDTKVLSRPKYFCLEHFIFRNKDDS